MDSIWKNKTEELKGLKQAVWQAGGQNKIEKQHAAGKLTARERIALLFDPDTFVELDDMMSSRATDFGMAEKRRFGDGVVTGYGKVCGRQVFVSAQDFTICGGSLGEAHTAKICRIMDKALAVKAPIVFLNDSGGARIEEGVDGLSGLGEIFLRHTAASGVIPQISVVLGPCVGGTSYSSALSDFVFMVNHTGSMYITGPSVVKSVIGETVSSQELGGADIHTEKSGTAHFVYEDDASCIAGVRALLAYLPQNDEEQPPRQQGTEVDTCDRLADLIPGDPRKAYDVRTVITCFADADSFFEVQPVFAPNMVVGFARLSGKTIGIVANQSTYLAGAIDLNASDKAARFIRFCDAFNIPLLTLVDVPAFFPGREQEHHGIIRHGAKMLYAYAEAQVPKVTLIMRKAYGGAFIAMNSKGMGADTVYAWPIAEIAVMGASGAIPIICRNEIAASADPKAATQQLCESYDRRFLNPYIAAQHGYIDDVILPEETRYRIKSAFDMLEGKVKHYPGKKHGSIPL